MELSELRTLFAYDTWSNELLLDSAARLSEDALKRDLGTSHGSIFSTLVHLVAAEELWLSRWKGAPKTKLTATDEVPDFAALRALWDGVRKERDAFLGAMTASDVERVMEMTTTVGVTYRHRYADMFRHVVNHSTYHRGQVVAMLRQLGEKPPSTDLIRFYRENPAP